MKKVLICLLAVFLLFGCAKQQTGPPIPIENIPNILDFNNTPALDQNKDQNKQTVEDTNKAEQKAKEDKEKTETVALGPDIDRCLEETPIKADLCILELVKSKKSDIPCIKIAKDLKDKCYYEAGNAALNIEICGKINQAALKDDCYANIGKTQKDPQICKNISNIAKKDDCYGNTPDYQICKAIFDPAKRDNCYTKLATTVKDVSICLKVSARYDAGQYKRDTCLANFTRDVNGEFCFNYVRESVRATCFNQATNKPSNDVNCSTLGDQNTIRSCVLWKTVATENTSNCYDIEYDFQQICIDKVIAQFPSIEACLGIKKSGPKNLCLNDIALDSNKLATCKMIDGNSLMRDLCINSIALMAGNEATCLEISKANSSQMEKCITSIALLHNDNRKCEKIQRDGAYVKCYVELALKNNLPQVCNKSTRETMKALTYSSAENCLKQYALAKTNTTVCDDISHSRFADECKISITIKTTCIDSDTKCDTKICTYVGDPAGKNNFDGDCTKAEIEQARADEEINQIKGF